MHSEYQLTIPSQTVHSSPPPGRDILEDAQAQLGFVPKMYARMVNSPGMMSTYSHGYKQFREASGLTPVEQEVVFDHFR